MSTNQEAQMAALISYLGGGYASHTYEGLWHAFWDDKLIASGSFDERMLAWINDTLVSSYTNVNEAMQAYAEDQGFYSWSSMGDGVDFSSGGTAGEAVGLLLALTKAA